MVWSAIVGGLAGAVGNKLLGGGGSTSSSTGVPKQFAPLADAAATRGMQLGSMPFTPYPYATVADFNPYQFQGFDMTAKRAQSGLPGMADQTLSGFMSGGIKNPFAGPNPYLQKNIDATLGDMSRQFNNTVAPTMAASALQSGSFGNSGAQFAENEARRGLAEEMGQVSSQMRMQDYGRQQQLAESGLDRRMGAVGMSPGIYQAGFAPADRMLGIGGAMQQQGQNVLNGWRDQFNQAQEWPFKNFDAMMAPFGRNIGSTTTTRGPSGNPMAGMLGGAMLGNQFGGQIGNWLGGLFGGSTPVSV